MKLLHVCMFFHRVYKFYDLDSRVTFALLGPVVQRNVNKVPLEVKLSYYVHFEAIVEIASINN